MSAALTTSVRAANKQRSIMDKTFQNDAATPAFKTRTHRKEVFETPYLESEQKTIEDD